MDFLEIDNPILTGFRQSKLEEKKISEVRRLP